jgi:hypothetical protein
MNCSRTFLFFLLHSTGLAELLPPRRKIAACAPGLSAIWGRSGLGLPIARRASREMGMRAVGHGRLETRASQLFSGRFFAGYTRDSALRSRGVCTAERESGQAGRGEAAEN